MSTIGGDANADMAKLLDTNVVLVIDSKQGLPLACANQIGSI
jgi:cobyrinic acid a,c-diamide synthase